MVVLAVGSLGSPRSIACLTLGTRAVHAIIAIVDTAIIAIVDTTNTGKSEIIRRKYLTTAGTIGAQFSLFVMLWLFLSILF